jgi:hypothetical protein
MSSHHKSGSRQQAAGSRQQKQTADSRQQTADSKYLKSARPTKRSVSNSNTAERSLRKMQESFGRGHGKGLSGSSMGNKI